MSMFHELMMRKKEEIMYATIKGSLTENDGVFSGFSASNYLQTSTKLTNETNFEFSITFTMPSTPLTNLLERLFMLSVGRNGLDIYTVNGVSHPHAYLKNINNQDYSFNMLSVTLEPNKTYTTKLIKQNTTYILECWSNGVKIGSETHSDDDININDFYYFSSTSSDRIFEGSIDLPNSYIKLGSTKYKLQAVVGYTVVGSLTESPSGVFSGFSSSDYLTLPSIIDESFKGKIRVKANTTLTGYDGIIYLSSGGKNFVVEFNGVTSARLYCYDETTSSNVAKSIWSAFSAETWYDIYFDYDKENKTMVISFKDTSQNLIYEVVYNNASLNGGSFRFGYTWNALDGSIDIINSYIYKSNKLWFNGQPS